MRSIYLRTSKNVKRVEGITKSPVFTHMNATLQGLSTIRAYGAQKILQQEFDKHQDVHSSAFYMFITTSSAFGFFIDFICFIYISLVTFSFLVLQVFAGILLNMDIKVVVVVLENMCNMTSSVPFNL
ncbi:unnamed protein product [Timema podura]|uniref:ABC transmembrane type-1 domain-containing protein n=1 Tax=Timema podura TaxID=61482 RepID=A0ABN7NVX1_TIMPD|nr:unnamed protein product [Timema podura]